MEKKRGAGEGSIYQRGDNRWCAVLNLGWESGKRGRKYVYGATAAEVQEQLLKARADHAAGLPVSTDRQTVAQFLDRWLEDSVRPSVRPLTHEQYRQHVKLYFAPLLGHHRLSKLAPAHVRAFINQKLQDGLSPRTVQLSITILRKALSQPVKDGLIGRNVAKLVDAPRWKRKEVMPWDAGEAGQFLVAIKGKRLEALHIIALSLGLRRGEALGLRWSDVDFQGKAITIAQALARIDGKLRFTEPKSRQSRRILPLHDGLIAALKAHRRRQSEERLAVGSRWRDSGLVFKTTIGTPLEPRALNEDFERILGGVEGLRRIRLHDLRHACASFMIAQGVHPRVVMEMLGTHKSASP